MVTAPVEDGPRAPPEVLAMHRLIALGTASVLHLGSAHLLRPLGDDAEAAHGVVAGCFHGTLDQSIEVLARHPQAGAARALLDGYTADALRLQRVAARRAGDLAARTGNGLRAELDAALDAVAVLVVVTDEALGADQAEAGGVCEDGGPTVRALPGLRLDGCATRAAAPGARVPTQSLHVLDENPARAAEAVLANARNVVLDVARRTGNETHRDPPGRGNRPRLGSSAAPGGALRAAGSQRAGNRWRPLAPVHCRLQRS